MSMLKYSKEPTVVDATPDTVVTLQPPVSEIVVVRNCSRLGRQANPPSLRLNFSWFRRR